MGTGDGSIVGAVVGSIAGVGDGAISVAVGCGGRVRVACGVSSNETFFTGSLGVGTMSGCGNSKLFTATRSGAGRRNMTRDCSRGGSTFNTIKPAAHRDSAATKPIKAQPINCCFAFLIKSTSQIIIQIGRAHV